MFLDEVAKPKDKCLVEDDGTILHNLGLENEEILQREMKGNELYDLVVVENMIKWIVLYKVLNCMQCYI
jgi:hypothetical protein